MNGWLAWMALGLSAGLGLLVWWVEPDPWLVLGASSLHLLLSAGLLWLLGRIDHEARLRRWASRSAALNQAGPYEAVIRVVKSSNFLGWRGFELHLGRFQDQQEAFTHARELAPLVEAMLEGPDTQDWGIHFLARPVDKS